jgi:hypothetical protein
MSDLEKAIKRLNDAIDAYEARQAAKALAAALVSALHISVPSDSTIDSWTIEECQTWCSEVQAMPEVQAYMEGPG